jgi:hypothetical protein
MSELRYLSTDGDYLLLEAADGTQYRLLIDESVRKAARREVVSEGDAAKISPRDIQLEVRSGVSVEDLAAKTGASLEYVQKFAAPVIDELAHVVSSALSVRITMAGDRYSETTQVEFGEVIANRLAATGVVQYVWTARKTDNGGWQLQCAFGDTLANWAFDPRKLALAPENEVAVQLSTQQSLTDGPLPKLRPVADNTGASESAAPAANSAPVAPAAQSPVTSAPVYPAPVAPAAATPAPVATTIAEPESPATFANPVVRLTSVEGSSQSITEDLGSTAEFDGVVPFGRTGAPAPASEPADLANTADLLDALRKRRLSREEDLSKDDSASTPDLGATQAIDLPVVTAVPAQSVTGAVEPAQEAPTESIPVVEAPDEESKAAPKRGRSSMPSWDEIVFSTKTDDED